MDKIHVISSTAPPAPNKWPIIDLVEFILTLYAWLPNASFIAFVSSLSFIGVLVPCALI